tara:strand:- start:72 stop:275 length:204 start_codon:yes stop_codon:yes gene_type:complete
MDGGCRMKIGDLVSKYVKRDDRDNRMIEKILYGVIINIEASELYVKVHWFGDYGAFWTNIWQMEVIT